MQEIKILLNSVYACCREETSNQDGWNSWSKKVPFNMDVRVWVCIEEPFFSLSGKYVNTHWDLNLQPSLLP